MHIQKRIRITSPGFSPHQGVVAPRCRLADVDKVIQHRHRAQCGVIMGCLMCVTPAQCLGVAIKILGQPDQGIVQSQSRHIHTGFHDSGLDHIAPVARAIDIAIHLFDEQGIYMAELTGQRPHIIADQTILQGAHPCHVNQRFRQVFVHLSVPAGQQLQRLLAAAIQCTSGRRGPREP